MFVTFNAIVAAATQLIQADFADPELDAQRISQRQHLDAGLLDTAFLHCRGRRCSDEIAMTRASKLFKLLSDHPQGNPEHAARRCGFRGFSDAGQAFQEQLGLELNDHLNTSLRALEDRELRRCDPSREGLLVGSG